MTNEYAKVYLIDAVFGLDRLYDYFVPYDLRESVGRGTFVTVPFGNANRKHIGLIHSLCETSEYENTKPILSVLSSKASLSEEMMGLCDFMKEQTLCTTGDAVHAILPAMALSRLTEYFKLGKNDATAKLKGLDTKTLFVYDFIATKQPVTLSALKSRFGAEAEECLSKLLRDKLIEREFEANTKDTGKYKNFYRLSITQEEAARLLNKEEVRETRITSANQKAVLSLLCEHERLAEEELPVSTTTLKNLVSKGLVALEREPDYRMPYQEVTKEDAAPLVLNEEQQGAYDTLCALFDTHEPKAALLHGVTGSGKTCVILKLIDKVLASGRGVICLLPEISLTPQNVKIFFAKYKDRVALVHSGLSAGERYDAYRRIREGLADVVIGTRSAVFAPVVNLGLIVIDEEQEHTYKSDSNPKYHARDIARYRCAKNGALMLLSSATPSLESYKKATEGVYTLIPLRGRYGKAKLPSVSIADMRNEPTGGNLSPIGSLLSKSLPETLQKGEQAILFLNRRGYNNFVSCRTCGTAITCPHCSVAMTYHTKKGSYEKGYLVCHWCGHRAPAPTECPNCGSEHMAFVGYGTQRVEQDLTALLPSANILRMDTDTTAGKFSYDEMLEQMREHKADLLIGTQMVTKGHDFPHVTLVGVLLADASLYLDDYRANERTFAMITQVIGRAGRADKPGHAIIQTNNPDNDIIRLACAQDYESFYAREIKLRKLLTFPPFCDIVLMTLTWHDEKELLVASNRLSEQFKILTHGEYRDVPTVVFGPFEAPVYRVDGKYRMRMVVKTRLNRRTRGMFADLLTVFSTSGGKTPLLSIDFNPSSL